MKTTLFFGGSPLIIPALNWAKEIGYHVVVNDRNPEAPGCKIADEVISIPSYDTESLCRWAAVNRPLICYSGNDYGMFPSAVIHSMLGIPGITIEESLLNKESVRQKIKDFVSVPPITTTSPCVVKPVNQSGSVGVTICKTESELSAAIEKAEKYGKVIIEEYISGRHFDVNAYISNGVFHPMGIAERFFIEGGNPVPSSGCFPADVNHNLIYNHFRIAIEALEIQNGTVKADIVVNNNDIYFIEISPCFHGDIVTVCMMGGLKHMNPVYQLLLNRYNNSNLWADFTGQEHPGKWELIGQKQTMKNYYIKNKPNETPKDNNEITGLQWEF